MSSVFTYNNRFHYDVYICDYIFSFLNKLHIHGIIFFVLMCSTLILLSDDIKDGNHYCNLINKNQRIL